MSKVTADIFQTPAARGTEEKPEEARFRKTYHNHWHIHYKACVCLPSQHSLVMRFKGMINGLPLWMERTDFSTAFPSMLAVS